MEAGIRELDAGTVARVAGGDRRALAELYDRHAAPLLGLARRMLGDRAEAEDLVQDVFVEVWHGAGLYRADRGTVRTWLLLRARSRALDRLRMRTAHRNAPPKEVPRPFADPDPHAERCAVVRALDLLPSDQRRALELAYYGGFTAPEIAAALGAPLGTVKSRLAGALGKLRTALQDPPREEHP